MTRAGRAAAALAAALWLSGPAAALQPRAATVRTSTARPDKALYQEAEKARAALLGNRRLQARRTEWDRVVLKYRRVVARYPQSPYCDNALLALGDLQRDMALRFKVSRLNDDAVESYRTLANEYPSSSLAELALWKVVDVARAGSDQKRVAEAARAYLAAFPESARAAEVKQLVRKRAPAQAAALPKAPPPGLAQVFNLRFWSGEASTRIVLDLERQVPLKHDRISDPDRVYVDLLRTRLHPSLTDRTFPVGDGLLSQIRVGQNRDDVVRVVLDFHSLKDYSVFYLSDPSRLVIDVHGRQRPAPAMAEATPPEPPPAAARGSADRPPGPIPAAATAPESAPPAPAEPEPLPQRRVAGAVITQPSPAAPQRSGVVVDSSALEGRPPAPRPSPAATPAPRPTPSAPARAAEDRRPVEPPSAPQPNRNGGISLARQLGLGARRIVIDAGHGGHDPGTIGPRGLQEKDLVLDVAQRLARLVRSELKAEVVMTRDGDIFIPLEERTAIANSKGADLFLSIHANSSPNRRARGIETYFLNFARNEHAEGVAARENAISAATLKDLQGLVKAITLNSKIDESRDFASTVQESLVQGLRPHDQTVQDRGVHTAPFYVLIGANMPSILAEIAFVSNPDEERKLRDDDYRDRIARSLLLGVTRYLEALNRTQLRQLTDASARPRLDSRGRRR